jgi:hypothetical protein
MVLKVVVLAGFALALIVAVVLISPREPFALGGSKECRDGYVPVKSRAIGRQVCIPGYIP